MSFLTLFTAPKAFTNPHIANIQRNALRSWMSAGAGDVQVLVIGEEDGLAETARRLGVTHLPQIARNQQGTPLVNAIFTAARQASHSPLLAYLNADILILPDFVQVARQVADQAQKFLVVGQRWDLDVTGELDFEPGWESRLRADLNTRGSLHPPAGSDYFIFPRHLFQDMPDFAIGRAGWDNWMIYHARQQGWAVIDATPSLQIIHQNHDYSHLPGSQPHYDLQESRHNMRLAGGKLHMYTVLDTDKEFIDQCIRPARPTLLRLARRAELLLTPKDGRREGPRWALARKFRRWRRAQTGSLD